MVVAAILHLGNVEFAKGEDIDSSVIKDDKSRFHLSTTAELLKYAPFDLYCIGCFYNIIIVHATDFNYTLL